VGLLLAVLNALLALIPAFTIVDPDIGRDVTGHIPAEWTGHIAAYLRLWDLFFPVGALFTCLLALLAVRLFVALVQFLLWVWDVLPFKSS
jgi:hypothetical protein